MYVAIINLPVSKGGMIMPPIRPELLDELLKDYGSRMTCLMFRFFKEKGLN